MFSSTETSIYCFQEKAIGNTSLYRMQACTVKNCTTASEEFLHSKCYLLLQKASLQNWWTFCSSPEKPCNQPLLLRIRLEDSTTGPLPINLFSSKSRFFLPLQKKLNFVSFIPGTEGGWLSKVDRFEQIPVEWCIFDWREITDLFLISRDTNQIEKSSFFSADKQRGTSVPKMAEITRFTTRI